MLIVAAIIVVAITYIPAVATFLTEFAIALAWAVRLAPIILVLIYTYSVASPAALKAAHDQQVLDRWNAGNRFYAEQRKEQAAAEYHRLHDPMVLKRHDPLPGER